MMPPWSGCRCAARASRWDGSHRVTHNPAQDLLVIDTAHGDRLVPFVTQLVPVVDMAAGYLEVVHLPGLLDPEDADEN